MNVRILFYNRPSVLGRLVGLFSNPGFNIDHMAVNPCEEPGLSHMVIKVGCNKTELQPIFKQIEKLQDVMVIELMDLDKY